MILPMTRARGRAEFVLDENRLNVALSRAKDAVVIFAHVEHLTHGGKGPLKRLLDHGERARTVDRLHLRPSKEQLRRQLQRAL